MKPKYPAPHDIVLAVTNKCNLRCKHCCAGDSLGAAGELSREEIFNLLDQFVENKVLKVCVFGGEPLCRDDIFDILDYIHKKPLGLSMNTNASLITAQIAKRLTVYKRLKSLTISLDGDTADVMDAMRSQGSFQQALRGIENILATQKIKVLLSVTVSRFNFKRLREIALLGRKIGAQAVRFNSVFFAGNAGCNVKELMLTAKEHKDTLDLVESMQKEFANFITGSYLQEVEIIKDIDKNKYQICDTITSQPCGAATKKCCVSADGWVTPCELIYNVRAGNVREKPFMDIWRDSDVMKSFREPLSFSLKGHPKCIGCRYARLCYQGHRCSPYHYSNNLIQEEVNCIVA